MMVGKVSVENARSRWFGAIEALEKKFPEKFYPIRLIAAIEVDIRANMLVYHHDDSAILFWDFTKSSWVLERPVWAQPN